MEYDVKGQVVLPAMMIPSFKTARAIEANVEKNILFRSWGGAGDIICSEPTVRYAIEQFSSWGKVSIASEIPEFFSHLNFDKVYDLKEVTPNYDNFLVFSLIEPTSHLIWEFASHMVTNCVDFPTICSLRSTLPIASKEIFLVPDRPNEEIMSQIKFNKAVFIHPGKHWPSKTFPKDWWDSVIKNISEGGYTPVILGGKADDNRTTVDVDISEGVIDLRGKLSWTESTYLLQYGRVLITNDSSPLHMAASRNPSDESSGRCFIGFIATCKHPDYISHWRYGGWSYRMNNLGLGGMWNIIDHCPNKKDEIKVDEVDSDILRSWLPDSTTVFKFVKDKMDNFFSYL